MIVIPNPATVDVKDFLLTNPNAPLSGLEFGTNLFIGEEPNKPDGCVTLFDTPGYPVDKHMVPGEVQYYRPSIQVRVRNGSYTTAYVMVNAIVMALHNQVFTVNDTTYTAVFCRQEPSLLDQDKNGRYRWVTTFDLQRRPGEGVSWDTYTDKTWETIAIW